MTAAETADFEAYLADRRRRDPRGPLFGVERPDGRVAPFSRRALGAICAEALRRASGLATVSSHSLRRAALTSAFLAIHEARAGSGAGARVLRRLTGWDRATRVRVAATLAPATLCRDGWTALACFAGHANAATTFSTYVAAADLAILDACARPPRPGEDDLIFVSPMRAVRLAPQGRSLTARRAAIGGRAAATPAALLGALDLVDAGHAPAAAASAARLPTRFLTDRLEIARAWSALATRRGELRLQPPDRAGRLAPDPLRGARRAEALDLAERLVARAADHPEPVERWIRMALHDATQTNAGQRLARPAELEAWLETALALRPAGRWQAEAVLPSGLEDLPAAWAGLLPADLPLTRRNAAAAVRSVVLRLRLRAPGTPAGTPPTSPRSSSVAGCEQSGPRDGTLDRWAQGVFAPVRSHFNDEASRLLPPNARLFPALQPAFCQADPAPQRGLAPMIIGKSGTVLNDKSVENPIFQICFRAPLLAA